MRIYVALCLVCLMVLSACDSGAAVPPARTADEISQNYLPIDLENVPENVSGMVMSGALNHNSGDVIAQAIQIIDQSPTYQHIDIETRSDYLLRLVHLFGMPEGEYPITTSFDSDPPENEFSVGLLNLWSPNDDDRYTVNPQGTVTLRYENGYVFGTYSLTVQNPAGDTVEIVGQYYAAEVDPTVP